MKTKINHREDEFGETEINEIMTMLSKLPDVKAPRRLKKELYRKLGIFYFPIYWKVLSLMFLSVLSGIIYLFAQRFVRLLSSKFSLNGLLNQLSLVYTKTAQAVSIIKVGKHLEDVFFAFASPWMVFGFAFVSSILILIFVKLAKQTTRGNAVLIRF